MRTIFGIRGSKTDYEEINRILESIFCGINLSEISATDPDYVYLVHPYTKEILCYYKYEVPSFIYVLDDLEDYQYNYEMRLIFSRLGNYNYGVVGSKLMRDSNKVIDYLESRGAINTYKCSGFGESYIFVHDELTNRIFRFPKTSVHVEGMRLINLNL